MRKALISLLLLSFTFVSCSSETLSTVVAPSVDTISADSLKQLLDSDPGVLFIDVRSNGEIERDGTVEGFIHIPIGSLEQRYSEIPKDKKIVVACSRGVRAARGAAILQNHGYENVLSTGLAEYKAKGYELIYPKLAQ